ncbi:MAG TPA: M4 family metallopeptidase, partial [Chitinophagaceae bacterium]|nr:M4 family metallopeptidase [Chitinophagaceae bacterium]
YAYESGALNESFADCIGEAVEEYTLGSADWIHRNEIGGGNRSFINPNSKGDPDTYLGTNWYTGTSDNGGVHTNSGVQNFWYYLLSVGGSGTNDNSNVYSVSGITIDKARLIAYDCMIALTSGSQYSNARSVSIQKAKDRYGDCSNEAIQTTNAWYAVGVGSAYVPPTPLSITISASTSYVCPGGAVTLTASGASTYAWDPGTSTGSSATFNPTNTTTYTVTGTDAEDCTGTKTKTITVTPVPTVNPSISDDEICPGQSTTLSAGTNGTITSLLTTLAGGNGNQGNAFDIHAYNSITITDFKMNISTGDSAEVWYNPGGYGNANVTSNTGWTKLGSTVPITAAGSGFLTTIPTTANLTIPAGSTYGIIVICNGSNNYTNGSAVGSIYDSNSDLYITEGHGGAGFGGTFNFINSPRIFNGSIEYRVNYTNYSWAPSATLSSSTASSPVASPSSSTINTLT